MNIPLKYNKLLNQKGFDCIRWSEIGIPNALDKEIMEYASKNDYIVMTCDLDFCAMLSITHELKPSIVQVRGTILHAEDAIDLISSALSVNKENLAKGAIISVDLKKVRIRLLPI